MAVLKEKLKGQRDVNDKQRIAETEAHWRQVESIREETQQDGVRLREENRRLKVLLVETHTIRTKVRLRRLLPLFLFFSSSFFSFFFFSNCFLSLYVLVFHMFALNYHLAPCGFPYCS